MTTVIMILAIWTVLSIPMSVLLGACIRDAGESELIAMDGSDAIFRATDGSFFRVSLLEQSQRPS